MLLAYLLAASPESQLRNGARLSISRNAFTAPPAPRSMALCCPGACRTRSLHEAAEWQRRMIAAAEQEKNTDLLADSARV